MKYKYNPISGQLDLINEGTVTSVDMTLPAAYDVTGNPITGNGTLAVTAVGSSSQYVKGDGTLASFPDVAGGGGGQVFYFNGGTAQGTFAGNAYYQLSAGADLGVGVDFTSGSTNDVPFAFFITDPNKPSQETVPTGAWVFQCYLSTSGSLTNEVYAKVFVYDTTTPLYLLGTSLSETLNGGSTIDLYTFIVPVSQYDPLNVPDRIAIQFFPDNLGVGETITLHTQDTHLSCVQTTFTTGLASLNGLTNASQYLQVGSAGTDFGITSVGSIHTFDIPTSSALNRGLLSSTDWSTFNSKQNALTFDSQPTNGSTNSVTSNGIYDWVSANFATTSTSTFDLAPVISIQNTPVVGANVGDRFLIGTSPSGVWASYANHVAEWDGSSWTYEVPINDNTVFITSTLVTLRYNGTAWLAWGGTAILQNGNSLLNTVTIGTNDAYSLAFKTNNLTRGYFNSAGNLNIGNASSTNQKQLRIGQGTSWIDIGDLGNNIGLWANQNTPSTGNVMLYGNASTTVINATSTIRLGIFSFDYLTLNLGRILFTPQTSASSATIPFEYTVPSNTLQTASTNIPNFKVQGGTKQWAAGAITNQYWNYFTANTAQFATTSSTITNSYGLFVESATVGTNAAITNNFGIGTDGNILSTNQYLYLGTLSPDFTNFTLRSTSSSLEVNSQTQSAPMYFRLGTSNRFIIDKNGTVGAENSFRFLPNNNTNQTASTEISAYLGQNFSRQWIGGNITTQREIYFKAATYNFTTNSIVTNAYGAYFEAAIAGTNANITNNYGLGVKGQVEFDFDGTNKFFRVKDWSGSFSTYGWGIMTTGDKLRLPNTIYIGDSSYYINRFDSIGDPVNSLYGGAFNVYKDFKAVGNLNSRIYVYGRNDTGHVGIGTATPTERLHISGGNLLLEDAGNIVLGTTTGTKIGTATTQKLGFYNATPIIQPASVTTAQGLADRLTDLGLLASGSVISSSGGTVSSIATSSPLTGGTITTTGTIGITQSSGAADGYLSSTDWTTFNNKIGGSGTTNEISYFTASGTIGSLTTATYPSLTELSYVKGVTSSIQTQIDNTYIPRIQSVISSATVTPTFLNDEVIITAQAVNLTLANPTGTPIEGKSLIIRIKDDGTARGITFDTQYRAINVVLPTSTTASRTLYLSMIYNATDTRWDVTGVGLENANPDNTVQLLYYSNNC